MFCFFFLKIKDTAEARSKNMVPQLISKEQFSHLTSEYSDEF